MSLLKKASLSLILVTSIFTLISCDNKEQSKIKDVNLKSLTTKEVENDLKNKSWIVVDTRLSDSYNGWILDGEKRGGHIPNAEDFSANWITFKAKDNKEKEKKLEEALKTKGITKDKNIILYDANGKDSKVVASYLYDKGYKNLYSYDIKKWAEDKNLPLEKYADYDLIVPAKILKEVIDGKKPETFENAKNIKVFEASWGEDSPSYKKGHVPTSVHINTDIIEPPTKNPPQWLLASPEKLSNFSKDFGINKDDTIILTGEEQMASYRVASVLKYMGVKDVRVLNGGNGAWTSAGYELETKVNPKKPGNGFGEKIPSDKSVMTTIPELKEDLKKSDFTLVDNRSWDEYIGKISGYSYHDKKGRIPGAVYGYAGTHGSTSLDYYRNVDNTMRNGYEIEKMWEKQGINLKNHLAFMCGSGWRAAEVYTYANVMGLHNTSIYSDGWIGWSDAGLPTETGEPRK
ncbi:rhodanese-like domain-containing protein [Clostridium sp.]|uniref:rhodanese-like domain-containing protein n=1 Tax=Clostridium sp. TaxID=1506 RepID=UPI00260E985A|nr:rhodanese-like domain-containing protein [Clostridium sp.]